MIITIDCYKLMICLVIVFGPFILAFGIIFLIGMAIMLYEIVHPPKRIRG